MGNLGQNNFFKTIIKIIMFYNFYLINKKISVIERNINTNKSNINDLTQKMQTLVTFNMSLIEDKKAEIRSED